MERWRGKVAIVTGASAGIGAAVAKKLVEEGLQVVGLARRKEKIEELAGTLAENPGKLYAVKCDISKEEDIFQSFQWVRENLGPVHILINNAGVARNTTLINGNINDWKTILNTNVLGLAIAAREAVKVMEENNVDGHIINVNSIVGHIVPPLPNQNMYPASKHAVTALTETLRQELVKSGSKIKISSISPGHVDTEIFDVSGYTKDEDVRKLIAISPSIKSDDVASAILYMLGTPPHVQVTELVIKPVGEFV